MSKGERPANISYNNTPSAHQSTLINMKKLEGDVFQIPFDLVGKSYLKL